MENEINKIYLSDVNSHPKGRCIDCKEYIVDNVDKRHCHCKVKTGYITMNALRKLACKEYQELIRPEFHDYLLSLRYSTKDILDAMVFVKKEYPELDYTNKEGQITIEVLVRDILEKLEPKNSNDCHSC